VSAGTSVSHLFREQLEAENSLIARRVSWLLLSQSFLFIAYTGALVARPPNAHAHQITRLLNVFPLLGVLIVASVYASILAALLSIRALRWRFDEIGEHADPFEDVPGKHIRGMGNLAAHVPAIAIGVTWIWLLLTSPS
jgi:hypothetical protein